MNFMTKETMIQYLKDYANLQRLVMQNPSQCIDTLFLKYMYENGRYEEASEEYYDKMLMIYTDYILFKQFSFVEDFLLNQDNYLNNNDLLGVKEGCEFYTDINSVTNKRIIELIRNAFNHNGENGVEKFKICENCENFEIELNDTRTKKEIENGKPITPFKMNFSIIYLLKLLNIINSKCQNLMFSTFDIPNNFNIFSNDLDVELDKITFRRYYFKKKLSQEQIKKIRNLSSISGYSDSELLEKSRKLNDYAKTIGDIAEFRLSVDQKNKIKYMIEKCKKTYPKFLSFDINFVMFYFLNNVIPVPLIKNRLLGNQIALTTKYFPEWDLSLENISRILFYMIYENGKKYNNMNYEIKLFKDLCDEEFVQTFPLIMYIDAVIIHCCDDDEICIDNVTYPKNRIRNSFVHGRWYISENNEIILFDANPRNINDYKLEEVGKISIQSFANWANNYMDNRKNYESGKKLTLTNRNS